MSSSPSSPDTLPMHCLHCGREEDLPDGAACPACGTVFDVARYRKMYPEGPIPARRGALKDCRELNDGESFWLTVLPCQLLAGAGLAQFAWGAPKHWPLSGGVIFVILALLFIAGYALVWPFLNFAARPRRLVILGARKLREEENDQDRVLERALMAALPRDLRMAVVRRGRFHVAVINRILGSLISLFRSLGAGPPSLEEDPEARNLLARLLATLEQSHAIVLDLREQDWRWREEEIRLCLRMARCPGRLWVLVNAGSTREWQERLKEIAHPSNPDLQQIAFVELPGESGNLVAQFRDGFAAIPADPFEVTRADLLWATDRVTAEDWITPSAQTVRGALAVCWMYLLLPVVFPAGAPTLAGVLFFSASTILIAGRLRRWRELRRMK